MNLFGKAACCAAALLAMAANVGHGAEPDWARADQPVELPSVAGEVCDGAPSCAGSALAVYVPNQCPSLQFNAGFLLLQPGADNLGYATITTFLPIQNPQWAVQTVNPDYQPGFNVGARYNFGPSGKDIQVNWDHLRTSDRAASAVSNVNTQWISPFSQTGPSTSESSNEVGIFHFKAADAQVNFAYDMVNLDAGQTVNVGTGTQVRLFAGLSFARLQEKLVSTFYNNPNIEPVPPVVAIPDPDLKYITLNNTSTFNGVGPRLGLSTNYNLCHGFTFVGQLSGAVLAGRMQPAQYSFRGVFDDAVDAEQISSQPVNQIVYASDAKLGVGYSRQLRNGSVLSIETGFRAAIFINPFSTYETSTNVLPLDIGSLSTNSMRHTPSNFTLNGFYLNGTWQW